MDLFPVYREFIPCFHNHSFHFLTFLKFIFIFCSTFVSGAFTGLLSSSVSTRLLSFSFNIISPSTHCPNISSSSLFFAIYMFSFPLVWTGHESTILNLLTNFSSCWLETIQLGFLACFPSFWLELAQLVLASFSSCWLESTQLDFLPTGWKVNFILHFHLGFLFCVSL